MSLTIELPAETVRALAVIAEGRGKSAEQYAREILEQEVFTSQKLKEMRSDAQIGLDALAAGQFTDYDTAEELVNDIRRESESRYGVRTR